MNLSATNLKLKIPIYVLFFSTLIFSPSLRSDSKTDSKTGHLVNLLLSEKSHRVRTQAAFSLANYPCAKSQDALLYALMDPHEAVRAATLSSLAKIGDHSVVPILRSFNESNYVVKDQLRRTIVYLEERFPKVRQPVSWNEVTSAIEIGSISDRSGSRREGLIADIRNYLARYFRMQAGFAVAELPNGLTGLGRIIKKNDIKALYVTGNLISLKKSRSGNEVVWEAVVSVAILDYQDKSMRATLNNRAEIHRPLRYYQPEHDQTMQDMAIEEAIKTVAVDLALQLSKL
ncbi:MAG: HEAT repeat domain-containing protein [Proteobacteria bacterium]|nr:HEAT repeat domain-containing protein [Pseudomonadota bacterium]